MKPATHKPLPGLDPDLAATLIETHWSATPEGVREKLASFLTPPESERSGHGRARRGGPGGRAVMPIVTPEYVRSFLERATCGPAGLDVGMTEEEAARLNGISVRVLCPAGFDVADGFTCPNASPECIGCPAKPEA